MAIHPPQQSPSPWAPRNRGDWLALGAGSLVILYLAGKLLFGTSPEAVPRASAGESQEELEAVPAAVEPAPSTPLPSSIGGRVGSVRLVAVKELPNQTAAWDRKGICSQPSLPTSSAAARIAIAEGWRVTADFPVAGYQAVMVDAGAEHLNSGCAPVGASLLIFVGERLVAIAYDRNSARNSKLASAQATSETSIGLFSNQTQIATVTLMDESVSLERALDQ